jgi:hypothetical protein
MLTAIFTGYRGFVMAGRANHPLKIDSHNWDQERVMGILLPRLAILSLPDAVEQGHDGRGLPSASTVARWLEDRPDWAAEVARARKLRAEYLVEEANGLIDADPERKTDGSIDPAHVRWTEQRINQRKWVAARLDRAAWGDQVQVDMQVHGTIDIVGVLAEARGRVIEGTATRELEDVDDLFT